MVSLYRIYPILSRVFKGFYKKFLLFSPGGGLCSILQSVKPPPPRAEAMRTAGGVLEAVREADSV